MNQSPKILTLVANTAIDEIVIQNSLSDLLTINAIQERATGVYDVTCPNSTKLTAQIRQVLYQLKTDFALQLSNRLPKKLFLSDMDSTIIVGETIDDIARTLNLYDKVSEITAAAMRGELSYPESLSARLALLKGIDKKAIIDITQTVQITQGADRLMKQLNALNIDSCLISGGFTLFTNFIKEQLGFRRDIANQLSFDENEQLDGHWVGELVTADVKKRTLITLATEKGITLAETIAIGDGANDYAMIEKAGLGIAFYGKPILREMAPAEIHSGGIDSLLYFL